MQATPLFKMLATKLTVLSSLVSLVTINSALAKPSQCANTNASTSHYRRLAAIDSLAESIQGIKQISNVDAKEIAHFRIIKNGCDEIKEITYLHGEQPKPIDENFSGNLLVPTSHIIFTHIKNQTEITFFDHAKRPQTVYQQAAKIVFTRDEHTRPIRVEIRDSNDALVNSSLGYAIATWQWSEQNTAIETRYDADRNEIVSGNLFGFSSAKVSFTPRMLLASLHIHDENLTVEINRNDDLAIASWRSRNQSGEPHPVDRLKVFGAVYGYDKHGYLERLKYIDASALPILSAFGHMGFQRVYTKAGNRLSYNFMDADDNRWAPPQRGYAGQNYTWREDGLVRIRTDYSAQNGDLINHPQRNYASIIYHYDDANLVTKRIFLDAAQKPLYARTP